jgi:hypothetical protein
MMRLDTYPAPITDARSHPAERPLRPAQARRAARSVTIRNPTIARPAAASAPIAVRVNGEVAGLALRQEQGFVFLSASHLTDAFDGLLFRSIAAIREAAGRGLSAAKPQC